METDTTAMGRLIVFIVIKSFRMLGLKANASVRDVDQALKRLTDEIRSAGLPESEAAIRLTEVSEAHETALSFVSGQLKPVSNEAAEDYMRFFNAYATFIDVKSDEEKKRFELINDEMQLALFDADYATRPMTYGNVQVRMPEGLIASWIILLIGIPVLIGLWNLHPVLGILGIVVYVLLLWKRKEAGQF